MTNQTESEKVGRIRASDARVFKQVLLEREDVQFAIKVRNGEYLLNYIAYLDEIIANETKTKDSDVKA